MTSEFSHISTMAIILHCDGTCSYRSSNSPTTISSCNVLHDMVSGHKAGVAGVYIRAAYADEKTAALELRANHVDRLEPKPWVSPNGPG